MKPVLVVCDTNILVSALLGSSINSKILEIFKSGQIVLLFSKETLTELAEVLRRPKFDIPPSEIRALFRIVRKRSRIVRLHKIVSRCRDPKDDVILEAAISGQADFLISGDQDILSVSSKHPLQIVTPRQFIDIIEK